MLVNLLIKNYALIDSFTIDFKPGFNVVSGETGSGKSMMLGALSLILGKRADVSVLYNPDNKCIVEGSFIINKERFLDFFNNNNLDFEDKTILRREITPNGKSRAFINDTPVKLSLLRLFCSKIIEVYSQHESLFLKESRTQMQLIDNLCQNQELLEEYSLEYENLLILRNQLKKIIESGNNSQSEADFHKYQLDELLNADLKDGEVDQIKEELNLLNNAENINFTLENSRAILEMDEGIIELLSRNIKNLEDVAVFNDQLLQIKDRLEKTAIELKDISSDIFYLQEKTILNPEQLTSLNNRLDLINSLLLKHKVTFASELITIKEDLKDKLENLSNYDQVVLELKDRVINQEQVLNVLATKLSKKRINIIPKAENQIIELLKKLGMPYANFKIDHSKLKDLGVIGIDEINFLFSANKGISMNNISSIISGGELSRFMLAIKYITSKKHNTQCLIFDEIDSGVSGEVASLMGEMMRIIASNKQVISITHLPQVAAKGDHHYLIYKEIKSGKSRTLIKCLNKDERINELAKLLSGKKITSIAMNNAIELLNQ